MSRVGDCAHCGRRMFIHGRGLCDRCYHYPAIREAYPAQNYQRFTAKQVRTIAELWGRLTPRAIGERIGRSRKDVTNCARHRGLPRLRGDGLEPQRRRAVRLIRNGYSAGQIAKALGVSKTAVRRAMKRWGEFPPAELRAARRSEAVRAANRRYCDANGFRNRGDHIRAVMASQAIALGWPFARTPHRARICAAVYAAGRLDTRGVLAALGGMTGRRPRCAASVNSLLRAMCRDGLLTRVKRGRYVIGPEAGQPMGQRVA